MGFQPSEVATDLKRRYAALQKNNPAINPVPVTTPLRVAPPQKADIERTIILNDLHVPYHDPQTVELVLRFVADIKPSTVYLNGDMLDFYQVSRFDRDPARIDKLQDDLDILYDFMGKLRRAVGSQCNIHYCEGNHEYRWLRYLWSHPEITNLRTMRIQELLRLADFNVAWHPQTETLMHHGVVVTHGSIVRRHSGASAKGQFEKYGTSGVSGHTHRIGAYYHTNQSGASAWYECGCLCRLDPEYMIGVADWQQCVTLGEFIRDDNRFLITTIPIIKHKILYQGRLYA